MSVGQRTNLASNASATPAAVALQVAGLYAFLAEGTFGGGTVKLQIQSPNGTWLDVSGGSLSAAGATVGLYLGAGQYRAAIATATGVYAYLIPCQ